MSSDLLKRFYATVLERDGTLHFPLTASDLDQFERDHDLQLPSDLRDLYLISNGTEYDDDMNRALPLEELRFSESRLFGSVVWFYEHSIFVQVWGIVGLGGQVIDWSDRLIAASVSDFLQEYIDHGIQPG